MLLIFSITIVLGDTLEAKPFPNVIIIGFRAFSTLIVILVG